MLASPVAGFFALEAILGNSVERSATLSKREARGALGEDEAKQLLVLMDTDKSGTISRREWTKFMEAEFEGLDKDGTGELDAKELAQSRLWVSRFVDAEK
jgi:Ca2+-binding EF-hand superfamily protein